LPKPLAVPRSPSSFDADSECHFFRVDGRATSPLVIPPLAVKAGVTRLTEPHLASPTEPHQSSPQHRVNAATLSCAAPRAITEPLSITDEHPAILNHHWRPRYSMLEARSMPLHQLRHPVNLSPVFIPIGATAARMPQPSVLLVRKCRGSSTMEHHSQD
jgi:hypothetical protein